MLLATVGVDKTLNIWSLAKILNGETNEPSRQAKFCHSEAITSVCWSHSRNLLITASLDCQVKIWRNLDATGSNLDNEAEIPQPQAADILTHPSAVMAVDLKFGCVVTTAKDGYIRVWSHKGVLITQLSDKTDDRNSEPTCCSLYFEDQKGENWLISYYHTLD